jgi:hypothetical protein
MIGNQTNTIHHQKKLQNVHLDEEIVVNIERIVDNFAIIT